MPACGLRRGSSAGPVQPIFIKANSRPSRGAKPRGADDARLPWERPRQAGSRGGREIKARVPREVPVMQAVTIKTRRAPAYAVSLFPLWCKGGKHRPRHQANVTVSVQQDQDQQNGRMEVIVEPRTASPQRLWQSKTNFIQDKCTRCSPSKWPIVGALPAHYLGRGPGPPSINRTSHHRERGDPDCA